MLQNDEKGEPIECICPRGTRHISKCPWYNPDIIYVIDNDHDTLVSRLLDRRSITCTRTPQTTHQRFVVVALQLPLPTWGITLDV